MSWKNASASAAPTRSPGGPAALVAILALALALRLGWIFVVDPAPALEGSDGPFFLAFGRALAFGWPLPATWTLGSGPGYPFYLSIFHRVLPEASVVQAARLGQALLDVLMCLAAFDLGRRLFDRRVGLLAAAALAVDLRFIVQAGAITTETVFIFLLVSGVWAFVAARHELHARARACRGYGGPAARHERPPPNPERIDPQGPFGERGQAPAARAASGGRMPRALGAAVIFILAAFTRPIALPVPVLLLASLLLPRPSRAQLIAVGIATGLVVAAVAAWSVRTYLSTGEWVIISNGLAGHFWLGSRGDGQWHGNAHFQAELEAMKDRYGGREAYVEDALKTIAADPPAYVRLLLVKLGQAYLQPHGTVAFPGESLKDLTVRMMQGQVSVGALLSSQAFWPKLYMYVFHLASLAGGLLGLWLSRRDWLKVLPLSLPIAYFTVAYTLLTNIPRYMFPIMPFYMILAAYAAIALAGPRAAPAAAAEV